MNLLWNFSQRMHPTHSIGPQTHVLEHFVVLGAFGNVSLLHEIRCTIGWNGASNGQVCAMKSHREFFATNAPDTSHWTVNTIFGAFHSVWVHFGLFRYCTKHGAKRADLVLLMQSFCHKVASEFFATNAPDPPRWALNSCFGASRSVWMHFGLFCYCTMLDTKRVELVQLMQKLVPWSRIRIFRNERNRSTPLDPKLKFWCVL